MMIAWKFGCRNEYMIKNHARQLRIFLQNWILSKVDELSNSWKILLRRVKFPELEIFKSFLQNFQLCPKRLINKWLFQSHLIFFEMMQCIFLTGKIKIISKNRKFMELETIEFQNWSINFIYKINYKILDEFNKACVIYLFAVQ